MLSVKSKGTSREICEKADFKTTKYKNFTYNSKLALDGVAYVYNGPMTTIGFTGKTTGRIESTEALFTLPYPVSVQQFASVLVGSPPDNFAVEIVGNQIRCYAAIESGKALRGQIVFFTYL